MCGLQGLPGHHLCSILGPSSSLSRHEYTSLKYSFAGFFYSSTFVSFATWERKQNTKERDGLKASEKLLSPASCTSSAIPSVRETCEPTATLLEPLAPFISLSFIPVYLNVPLIVQGVAG